MIYNPGCVDSLKFWTVGGSVMAGTNMVYEGMTKPDKMHKVGLSSFWNFFFFSLKKTLATIIRCLTFGFYNPHETGEMDTFEKFFEKEHASEETVPKKKPAAQAAGENRNA